MKIEDIFYRETPPNPPTIVTKLTTSRNTKYQAQFCPTRGTVSWWYWAPLAKQWITMQSIPEYVRSAYFKHQSDSEFEVLLVQARILG